MKKHWSFIVCSPRILLPIVIFLTLIGVLMAYNFNDFGFFNRFGNFIVGIGVWMSLRYTLREGIRSEKNLMDSVPFIEIHEKVSVPNSNFFNEIAFSIVDAKLQIYGFVIVVYGNWIVW